MRPTNTDRSRETRGRQTVGWWAGRGEALAGRAVARGLAPLLARAGERGRITRVRRRPSPYRSTHALEEVAVGFEDGRTLPLVLKAYGARGLLAGEGSRPRFIADPYRELWAYESVLGALRVGAPRFYGTLEPHGSRVGRLVLERVRAIRLSEAGELGAWTAAARWLAGLHRRGAPVAARVAATGHPVIQDPTLHRRWLARAMRHARERDRRRELATLERIAPTYDRAVRGLAACPPTVLHGEAYASNVLVGRRGDRWSVRPVDWEALAVGPAVLDLAALASGRWDRARRAALVEAYRRAAGDALAPPEAFDALLARARLVIAVQWLGWAKDWHPPSEQAQDWLAEAARAAEAIGR